MKYLPLALLAVSSPALAQDWVVDLNDEFGVAQAVALPGGGVVLRASDSAGFQLGATDKLVFLDANGAPEAEVDVSSTTSGTAIGEIALRPDGNLLLLGEDYPHMWIGAMDPTTRTMLWETTTALPSVDYSYHRSLDETDQGIVVGGYVQDFAGTDSAHLVRYDSNGNLVWSRIVDTFVGDGLVTDVSLASNGDVFALVFDNGTGALCLTRLDPFGNELWTQALDGSGQATLQRLSDGNLLLTKARYANPFHWLWVAKLDESGSVLWEQELKQMRAAEIVPDSLGGATLSVNNSNPTMVHLDAAGTVAWHKHIPQQYPINLMARPARNADDSLLVAWNEFNTVSSTFLGRFHHDGSVKSSCGAQVTFAPLETQASSEGLSPSSLSTAPLATAPVATPGRVLTPGQLIVTPVCGDPRNDPPSFCQTSPNSVGAGARIDSVGSISVFANDLTLVTTGLGANKTAIYFYGSTPTNKPFGNGRVCVGGQKKRLGLSKSDGAGVLTQDLDLAGTPITAGSQWYFQCWYRDPAGGGAGTNLSDGLATTWMP